MALLKCRYLISERGVPDKLQTCEGQCSIFVPLNQPLIEIFKRNVKSITIDCSYKLFNSFYYRLRNFKDEGIFVFSIVGFNYLTAITFSNFKEIFIIIMAFNLYSATNNGNLT